MKAERHDEKFFDDLRDRLDQAADDLSPDIRRRLAQARARALETPAWKRFIIPAGGLAVAASLALIVVVGVNDWQNGDEAIPEMDIVAGNVDMYEDLEFYRWLAEADIDG
jgi:negative regulator of sigma E activity